MGGRARRGAPDLHPPADLRGWLTLGSWVVFAAGLVRAMWVSLGHDFRKERLVADQASFVAQALSIAYDRDLSITQVDVNRWVQLDWAHNGMNGLYFQRFHDGWAYAKPYGYSVWLAPFMRVFGPARGVAIANLTLFVLTAAALIWLLRRRYDGPAVPLVAGAFLLVTNAMLYLFPVGPELFYLCLTALFFVVAWYAIERQSLWPALVAVVIASVLVSEKASIALILVPALVYVLVRLRGWGPRAAVVVLGAVVFAGAVFPYWHYSEGKSFTPYGGERYYALNGRMPFEPGSVYLRAKSDEVVSVHYSTKSLTQRPQDKGWAILYYVIGEHTGLLVYMPIALFIVLLALFDLRRSNWFSRTALIGLGLYVLFYVLLFPRNTYGGGQAIGNRYFLQISPVVIAVAVGSGIRAARLAWAGLLGLVLPIVLLWPQLYSPHDDLYKIYRTSPAQRLLLYESHVSTTYFFHPPPPPPKPPSSG
jgi:hypothetical protein